MKPGLRWTVRLFVAGVFLYAGLPKIVAPYDFALALFRYRLLPDGGINAAALLMPWMEVCAALALLHPRWRAAGTLWLTLLLGAATAAVAIALSRGLDIDCGCFTLQPGRSPIGPWTIARNLGLIALTLWSAGDRMRRRG